MFFDDMNLVDLDLLHDAVDIVPIRSSGVTMYFASDYVRRA